MIVKADGKPYATYESAKQQLSAKWLGDTHEVVERRGGYGIAPKDSGRDGVEEVFGLTPGDYVKLDGMSDERCALVAEAMICAGAKPGAGYPYLSGVEEWDIIFWDAGNGLVNRSTSFRHPGAIREVTVNQIVGREDQVTLRPGDYVSTKGMTEEQYHAVAEAFMTAGAEKGEYPNWSWASDQSVLPNFGWFGVEIYHGNGEFSGRQLTISQVLSSTSAKRQDEPEEPEDQQGEPCPSVLDTLRLAQQRVNEAAHELAIAQGVRDEALESVRAELGEGFEVSVVEGMPTGVDMSDPANWREGDLVECIDPAATGEENYFSTGMVHKLVRNDGSDRYLYIDNDGDSMWANNCGFRFHSPPHQVTNNAPLRRGSKEI